MLWKYQRSLIDYYKDRLDVILKMNVKKKAYNKVDRWRHLNLSDLYFPKNWSNSILNESTNRILITRIKPSLELSFLNDTFFL